MKGCTPTGRGARGQSSWARCGGSSRTIFTTQLRYPPHNFATFQTQSILATQFRDIYYTYTILHSRFSLHSSRTQKARKLILIDHRGTYERLYSDWPWRERTIVLGEVWRFIAKDIYYTFGIFTTQFAIFTTQFDDVYQKKLRYLLANQYFLHSSRTWEEAPNL